MFEKNIPVERLFQLRSAMISSRRVFVERSKLKLNHLIIHYIDIPDKHIVYVVSFDSRGEVKV